MSDFEAFISKVWYLFISFGFVIYTIKASHQLVHGFWGAGLVSLILAVLAFIALEWIGRNEAKREEKLREGFRRELLNTKGFGDYETD